MRETIFSPVRPASPPARQFQPRGVATTSIVGASAGVPSSPGLVLASARPGWPAPTSAGAEITAQSAETVTVPGFSAGRIVSESIFGGPVTVGDPSVTTQTISPYTDKYEAGTTTGIPRSEGWTDVFGRGHGATVPADARTTSRSGGGAFGVRTPLQGFGAVLGGCNSATMPPNAATVWSLAGKACDSSAAGVKASGEWIKGWMDWANTTFTPAQRTTKGTPMTPDDYAVQILAYMAPPPAGWIVRPQAQDASSGAAAPPPPPVGMSTGAKVGLALGAVVLVGGAVFMMKRRSAAK